ncbi:hypothetical protein [Ralstonia psammae]|uniref:hypothetical protein n=1 Tax=Ralstonia psammae TaxID=3058598 RepID=UPI00292DB4A8|nr:hypothetical protein [Ralstonia sp. LMG 19083]
MDYKQAPIPVVAADFKSGLAERQMIASVAVFSLSFLNISAWRALDYYRLLII